jgi:hypothetical protein
VLIERMELSRIQFEWSLWQTDLIYFEIPHYLSLVILGRLNYLAHYDRSGLPPPNPDLETPERSSSFISIVILKLRTQRELIRIEIQPTIQDSHRICMLNHSILD